MALETYRIIYKTSPVLIHDIEKIKQNSYNFRYNNTADIPRPEQQGMVRRASVMRQQDSGTPCLIRQGTFQPLVPSKNSYQPGVFLKIVFAALVERSYLAASYQNSSSPCFYVLISFFIVLCY